LADIKKKNISNRISMPLSFCVKNQISQKDQKHKVPRKSRTDPTYNI
jgi:hypothetical protein